MKKNLLSILILALLIVNIVMTAIMMFSITGMTKSTTALVKDIASAVKLDLSEGTEEEAAAAVPMEDTEVHAIESQMTIPLKMGEDGMQHYAQVAVSLSMNTKDEGYKKYGATIATKESLIQDQIFAIFGTHTMEECQSPENQEMIKQEIVKKVQEMYDSKFVYQVNFSDIKIQ